MRKWEHPSRLEREAVPEPRTPIAAGPAAVLRLQRAAGNRAVSGALPVQRYQSKRVPADEVAERTRHEGHEPMSEKNLAVAYVAEMGSVEAKPEPPVWSSGTQDPDLHAERIAVRQAQAGGALLNYHPRETEGKRIVRVYTELAPCSPCYEWLTEQLNDATVVQWTAPPHSPSRWEAQVPNALWHTRVALLTELYGLWPQATSPDARDALEQARNLIVEVELTPAAWGRHPSVTLAAKAAEQLDADWRRAVAAVRAAVQQPVGLPPQHAPAPTAAPQNAPAPIPQHAPAPMPMPQNAPPVHVDPAPRPVHPAAPVPPGTLDQWLARSNPIAALAKRPAAPALRSGGPAPHIRKAVKIEAQCLEKNCGKVLTVNKSGKLRAHKKPQGARCPGGRYQLL